MALSMICGNAGVTAEKLATTANLTFEQVEGKWTITTIHLDLVAKVPGVDAAQMEKLARDAKENCPISRLLNAKITLAVRLEK
jgi:osmotically inducible protein OsmC